MTQRGNYQKTHGKNFVYVNTSYRICPKIVTIGLGANERLSQVDNEFTNQSNKNT